MIDKKTRIKIHLCQIFIEKIKTLKVDKNIYLKIIFKSSFKTEFIIF